MGANFQVLWWIWTAKDQNYSFLASTQVQIIHSELPLTFGAHKIQKVKFWTTEKIKLRKGPNLQ